MFLLFRNELVSAPEMWYETLIGEYIAENEPGKVYGSHFTFSHLWRVVTYR